MSIHAAPASFNTRYEEIVRRAFASSTLPAGCVLVEPGAPISFSTRFEEEDSMSFEMPHEEIDRMLVGVEDGYWTQKRMMESLREEFEQRELSLVDSHLGMKFGKDYDAASKATTAEIRLAHAEKKEKKKHAKRKPRKQRPEPPAGLDQVALDEWHLIYHAEIESWKRFEAMLKSREREYEFLHTHRFVWRGGSVAGRWVYSFVEDGLRSANSNVNKRFVQITPARGSILAGHSKDAAFKRRSKLLALTLPYVRINTKIIQAFRIDLDGSFAHEQHLMTCLRDAGLPIMPDIVVFDRRLDGVIYRPHLWFFLPIGSGVWNDPDDPRFRKGPLKLLFHVMAAIIDCLNLKKLGADPGGLANPFHGKNPLCPLWRTIEPNRDANLALEEWARLLGIARTDEKASEKRARLAAQNVSGLSSRESNGIFSAARTWAREIIQEIHAAGGQRYADLLSDRQELARVVRTGLHDRLAWSEFTTSSVQSRRVLDKVADYAATWWKPELAPKPLKIHGRMGELEGTPQERMSAGGKFGAERKKELSTERLAAAAIEMMAEGVKITRAALAKRADVDPRTASKHFDAALTAAAEKSAFKGADKKLLSPPCGCVSVPSLGETFSSNDVKESEAMASRSELDTDSIRYLDASGGSWFHRAHRLERLGLSDVDGESLGLTDRLANDAPANSGLRVEAGPSATRPW
jgi:hypothetical protein